MRLTVRLVTRSIAGHRNFGNVIIVKLAVIAKNVLVIQLLSYI